MSTRSSIILAVAALIIGFTIGGLTHAAMEGRSTERLIMSSWTLEAGQSLALLKHLRADNTTNDVELLEILETQLDGELLGLGEVFLDAGSKPDPACIKVLERARDYRAKFPHQSSSRYVDELIAKDFSLLDAQTGHHAR